MSPAVLNVTGIPGAKTATSPVTAMDRGHVITVLGPAYVILDLLERNVKQVSTLKF